MSFFEMYIATPEYHKKYHVVGSLRVMDVMYIRYEM